ncbi:MAG: HEAT repeat domain-containing protein [Polyangiaceae bacterium]
MPPLPRTLAAALRDISSKKPEIRADALRDLARHAEQSDARAEAVRPLEGALRDSDPRVRAATATALADVGGTEALAGLLVAVEDDDPHVRQMAISALGELGDAGGRAPSTCARGRAPRGPLPGGDRAIPRVTARPDEALKAVLAAMEDSDALVAHIAVRMAEELAGEDKPDTRVIAKAKLLAHDAPAVSVAAAVLLARASARTEARAAREGVDRRARRRRR